MMNPVKAFTLIALGLAIAAMGIYVADADDAPGAAVIGMLLMVVGVVLGVRAARNRLPMWAARTTLAVGVAVAAFGADESCQADRAGGAGDVLDDRRGSDAGALQHLLHHACRLIPAAAGRRGCDDA